MVTSQSELSHQVQAAYSQIARSPAEHGLFPCGRPLAEDLGYPAQVLDSLPGACVEAFCGVGKVSLDADIRPGEVVLDAGCGAGLDTILAARRAAKVVGVDFSLAMLERTQLCLEEAGLEGQITLLKGEVQRLPLMEASIDVVMVNGLFNLNPFREEIFLELARVLRPGGRLYASELVLREPADLTSAHWFQ